MGLALVEAGDTRADEVFGQALETLQHIPDKKQQAYALLALTKALAQAGRVDEAINLARSTPEGNQAETLQAVVTTLGQAGRYAEGETVALGISDRWKSLQAQRDLAGVLAQAGRYDEALGLAYQIPSDQYQAQALSKLAALLLRRTIHALEKCLMRRTLSRVNCPIIRNNPTRLV